MLFLSRITCLFSRCTFLRVSEGGILKSNTGIKVRDGQWARIRVEVEVARWCLALVLLGNDYELPALCGWRFFLLAGTLRSLCPDTVWALCKGRWRYPVLFI
jgi:hypothetical protein